MIPIRSRVLAPLTIVLVFAILLGIGGLSSPADAAPRRTAASTRPPATEAAPKKPWTVMIFMAADNNLEGATPHDINELETVGSTDKVNFLVQVDLSGRYAPDSEFKWVGARRLLVRKDNQPLKVTSPVLQDLGLIDMSAPEALVDFVKWSKAKFPAERYALILWNHGTGWKEIQPSISALPIGVNPSFATNPSIPGISYNISYDDGSGSSMDIPTLHETLGQVVSVLGQPLDLLGFDACLMQMIEVAHAAAPYAKYQIGSTDLEPERGWPYDLIAAALTKNPAMDGMGLGKTIIKSYCDSYSMGSQGNTAVTLSLLDLSRMDQVIKALDGFTAAVRADLLEIDNIDAARDQAFKFLYKDYVDLGNFLKRAQVLSKKPAIRKAALDLLNELTSTATRPGFIVQHGTTGEKFKGTSGLSIFFPDRQGFRTYKNRYKLLSLSRETGWFSMLSELESPSIPYFKVEEVVLEDENKDGRIAAGEKVKVRLTLSNHGKAAGTQANVLAQATGDLLDKKAFSALLKDLPGPGKKKTVEAFSFTVKPDAPLNSEVTLHFVLRGDKMPTATSRVTFFIKAPFATQGNVLLAFSDSFSPAAPVLQAMLHDAGQPFDVWDRMLDGDLKPEVLKRYLDGWVLLSVQDSSEQQKLSDAEVAALTQFLQSGGRLVLSGQDLAFSLRDSAFLREFCRVSFVQDDINVHVISGQESFCKGKSFQIYGGDGANNQKWPDEVDALRGARVALKYNEAARDLANDRDMNGPDLKPGSLSRGIKSTGTAAVEVVDGYRLLFFAFGIEAINSPGERQALVKAIRSFMVPTVPQEVRAYAAAAEIRPRSVARSDEELLQQTDMLNRLERRITDRLRLDHSPNGYQEIRQALDTLEALPDSGRTAAGDLEKNLRTLLEFRQRHGTIPTD
jgi:hypothetical protein